MSAIHQRWGWERRVFVMNHILSIRLSIPHPEVNTALVWSADLTDEVWTIKLHSVANPQNLFSSLAKPTSHIKPSYVDCKLPRQNAKTLPAPDLSSFFWMLEQARATRIQLPLPNLFPTQQLRSETMHVRKTVINKWCSGTLCLHHSCTCFVNACGPTSDGYPAEKRLSTVIWNLFCDSSCETLPLLRSSALELSAEAHLYKGVIELMCR